MSKIEITVGTHFFQVRPTQDQNVRKMIYDFVRRFVKVDVQGNERKITTYASANTARTWFRFHINTFSEFDKHLKSNGFEAKDVTVYYLPEPDVPTHKFNLDSSWSVLPHQEPVIEYLTRPIGRKDDATGKWVDGGSRQRLVGLQTGRGKLVRDTTLVKVPLGWKPIGQMRVGDKVMAVDGTYANVVGVFPEKQVQLYRVMCADGRYLDVHGEHLWEYFYVNTSPHKRWRVGTTLEMAEKLKMPNPRVYIPLPVMPDEPVASSVPIDPYYLGLMLGDGHLESSLSFTNGDQKLVDSANSYLLERGLTLVFENRYTWITKPIDPSDRLSKKKLIDDFKVLGLYQTRSWNKFVPRAYLNGNYEQRLAVLQGLLDTDGSVVIDATKPKRDGTIASGKIEFTTVSEQLAKDVVYLVRSLGGIAKCVSRITNYTYNGEVKRGRLSYRIYIRHPKPTSLFQLDRKRDRLNDDNQYSPDLKLRVVKIEAVDVADATCISIDHHRKLYVCENWVVTHNTFCALKSITDLGYKFVVIVLARFVKNWVKEIQKITDIKAKEILLVDSSSAMKALTEMAVTPGSMDPYKAIVMGNRSFISYITAFENSGADIEALGYMVTPDELWPKLGVGIRLIDEVHMEFHANFRLDLYTHIKRTISLSATLISDDPHEKRMHNIAYPKDERSEEQQLTKYIDSFGVVYTIPNRWHYKTAYRGSSNYSHAAFEDSILRNKDFTKAYADMHIHWLKHGYQKNWQPDHKAIVFASTKEMCAELTKQISNAFPNYTVRRYVAEDGGKKDKQGYEENYQKPHIRVTTIGSGGTGHDIKGLTDNILGVGLSSTKSNVQVLGRLRDIPGKQTRFYYMSCLDIPKQMHYHMAKKDLLKQRAKSFTPLHYGELGDNRYRT